MIATTAMANGILRWKEDPPRLASLLRRFGKVVEVAESVPQPPLTVPQMA